MDAYRNICFNQDIVRIHVSLSKPQLFWSMFSSYNIEGKKNHSLGDRQTDKVCSILCRPKGLDKDISIQEKPFFRFF